MKVGVFHPGTQRIQEVSLAFQRWGMLTWCATGVYYKSGNPPYSWVGRLPQCLRQPMLRELLKRRDDKLEDARVVTHGAGEWVHLLAYRVPLARRAHRFFERARTIEFGHWLARSARLREVDAVYGFNGMSLEVFRAAKATGKACILDQTSAHSGYHERILREEAGRVPNFGNSNDASFCRHLCWMARREREEYRLADLILTGSDFSKRTLAEGGANLDKVHVVGNVTTAPVHTFCERPPKQKVRFLYVGSVSSSKGIRYLVEAMQLVREVPIELLMVGRLGVRQSELAPYAGLIQHHPHVPRSELWNVYKSADVFVFPSLSDGFGRVLLEAASMSLPIIATTACGADQIIRNSDCGILVPPGDARALAAAIRTIASDAQLRAEMGRRACERSKDFTFDNYARRVVQATLKIASGAIAAES